MVDSDDVDDPAWYRGWPVGPPELCRRIVFDDPYGRVTVTTDGVVRHVNPAAADMLGLPVDQVVGRSVADFLSPASIEVATLMFTQVMATESLDIPIDFELARPDGRMLPVEVGGHRYLDDPEPMLHLRIRPAARDRYMERFLTELVSGAPIDESLGLLARSIDATVPGSSTAIVHGWDGDHFTGVTAPAIGEAMWQALLRAALDPEVREGLPWVQAIRSGRVTPVHRTVTALPDELATIVASEGYHGLWVFPVLIPPDAGPTAAVGVWRRAEGDPLHGQAIAVAKMIDAVALAIERDRSHRRLLRAATRDSLTDLLNREEIMRRIDERIDASAGAPLGVLYVDLDRFKPVNDLYGHRFGDSLLAQVGAHFAATVRATDHLARVGGDEFVALCPDVGTAEAAVAIGESLVSALDDPLEVDGVSVRVGASVGVALAPHHGHTATGLIDAADRALYAAKRAGRGCVRVAD